MPPRHIFLMILLTAIWGFNFVPIRIGLDHVPPLTFGALRFMATAFPAVFFIRRPQLPLLNLIVYGMLTFGGQFFFLFTAIHAGFSPGLASLIMQAQAFFTIGFSALFFREWPRAHQIIGTLIALAGIGVVAVYRGGEASLGGLLLLMAAAASWGAGNVMTKSFGKVDMFAVIVWGNLFALPPLLLLAWMQEGHQAMLMSVIDMHWPTLLSLAYNAYMSTFIGYTLWNVMLSRYPAVIVAPFSLLVPPFAMLSTYLCFGEPYPLWKFMATILILAGLAYNQFGGNLSDRFRQNRKTLPEI